MSTIKTTTLSTQGGSTVPMDTVVNGTAKAWVNFNGTGTVAIRRAFNVSSISDNGTGDYSVNFTTAMVDAEYCSTGSVGVSSVNPSNGSLATFPVDTSSCRCEIYTTANVRTDFAGVFMAIFR